MRSVRKIAIPIDHLVAEVAAFPLGTERALELGTRVLDPTMRQSATRKLWRHAEVSLLHAFPAFSVEEIVAARDRLWFGDSSERLAPLGAYLRGLVVMFLRSAGGTLQPWLSKSDERRSDGLMDPAIRARNAWRWMTFALPPDLLAAACDLDPAAPMVVDLVPPVVAQCLFDHRYAETHLHVGAALDFSSFWVAALRGIADPGLDPKALYSPGGFFEEGQSLLPWLLRAAVARYCLAVYLRETSSSSGTPDFQEYVGSRLLERVARLLDDQHADLLKMCLTDLARGQLTPRVSLRRVRALYAALTEVVRRRLPVRFASLHDGDCIASLLSYRGPRTATPEVLWLRRGLRYLERHSHDDAFAQIFWQVVRVRTIFYRHVTQRPLTPGLQWFIRTYGRLSALRRPLDTRAMLGAALETGGRGKGLKSLEVRTAPEPRSGENLKLVRAVADVARDVSTPRPCVRASGDCGWLDPRCRLRVGQAGVCVPVSHEESMQVELGLVLHLVKSRGKETLEGRPQAHWRGTEADPTVPGRLFRYGTFYAKKRREVLALAWVLLHFPGSLQVLRGIDICTDELGVPTWVMVPLVRYLRDVGKAAARYLAVRSPTAPPPLRTTVHAGEDFVHLLGGLRRIDEAVNYLCLGEGDRIGHGVALGVDARGWALSAGRLPIAREERLLDLVWEWQWYARGQQRASAERLALIEYETLRLTKGMFDLALSASHMARVVDRLHDEGALRELGFPAGCRPRKPTWRKDAYDELDTLERYLTRRHNFFYARAIEWVDPEAEGDTLATIQCGLRREIAARGLTVEVNPSSNLLIANLADLTTHPLWRLRPPRHDGDAPPVAVCVGSDDPITFATNLREEFGLLHDALMSAGLSDDEAQHWLSEVRQRGLDTRFTLPPPPSCGVECLPRPVLGLDRQVRPVL